MQRTIPYDPALLSRNQLNRDHFVRIVLPSPHGTLRYTNHYLGTQSLNVDGAVGSVSLLTGGSGYTTASVSFTAAPSGGRTATGTVTLLAGSVTGIDLIDEGEGYTSAPTPTISGDGSGATASSSLLKTWTYWDFVVGPVDQGEQDILSVSWISFQSLDNTWQNFASDPGLRRRDISIWRGWYDGTTFDDAILLYEGRIDGHEILSRATLSLVPHNSSWPQQAPWAKPGPLCYFPYQDEDSCQYTGIARVEITSGGSGYATPPTPVFTAGGGTGAAGTAAIGSGAVTSVTMTVSGNNYEDSFPVTFTGGGGTGAAGIAHREPLGEATCPKTRAGCIRRLNTARFPSDDLAPLEGTIIYR